MVSSLGVERKKRGLLGCGCWRLMPFCLWQWARGMGGGGYEAAAEQAACVHRERRHLGCLLAAAAAAAGSGQLISGAVEL